MNETTSDKKILKWMSDGVNLAKEGGYDGKFLAWMIYAACFIEYGRNESFRSMEEFKELLVKLPTDKDIERLKKSNKYLTRIVSETIEYINDRWISVDKGLPEYGEFILGLGPKNGYYVCEFKGVIHSDGKNILRFMANGRRRNIHHWMPLPVPYKKTEDK